MYTPERGRIAALNSKIILFEKAAECPPYARLLAQIHRIAHYPTADIQDHFANTAQTYRKLMLLLQKRA